MYNNLIDAITHMDGDDAKMVLVCLMQTIDDELHDCEEASNHVDNLRDSIVFNDALCWVKGCVEQTIGLGLYCGVLTID